MSKVILKIEKDFELDKEKIKAVLAKEVDRQEREYLGLSKNPVHKMNHLDAVKAWELWNNGYSIKRLAESFKVSESSIYGILSGRYYPEAEAEFKRRLR